MDRLAQECVAGLLVSVLVSQGLVHFHFTCPPSPYWVSIYVIAGIHTRCSRRVSRAHSPDLSFRSSGCVQLLYPVSSRRP